uniref:Uncharacterized protein n=1 Tax=Aegilops tauschii subsp. strangulata TaxID=200361 RepID=A0A453MXM6_AEGTS
MPPMQQIHHAYQQYNPNAMQPLLPQVAMQYSLSSQQQLPLVQQQLQPSQTWQQQPSAWWPATAQQGGPAAAGSAVPAPQYGGVIMPNGSSAQAGNLGGAPWGQR